MGVSGATFVLEGFEPISRLGGGGFGDVWLARQTNVDRHVAIKVGHSAIQDETIRLRFDRECKALGRLSGHPNIVDVYTAGSLTDGRPYLVLEYISGGTLWQRLKKRAIPEHELQSIGRQLSAALAEAHTSGVLHRDLKPENILIRSTGEAVLGDFGIARLHDGANTTSAAITASVAYAAPEILSGKRATVASDLYGIGVCLLAAVYRSVPFVQKNDDSIHPIINRVLSDAPPDVRMHGVSEGLAALIDALLAKDPRDRPESAAELVELFGRLPDPAHLPPPPPAAGVRAGASELVAPGGTAPSGAPLGDTDPRARQRELAAPGAAAPAAPVAPQRPARRNRTSTPAAPRPEDVAPGRHESGAVPAWAQGGGGQAGHDADVQQVTMGPGSNFKLFALAYLVTVILAGLGAYIAFQVLDDGGEEGSAATGADQTEITVAAPDDAQAGAGTAGAESEGSADGEQLELPLAISDTSFGPDAETSDDSPGPGADTLCDNAPATDGLVDWRGQVITAASGTRSLYQVVSRFESPEQAEGYVDAYAGTNDCDSWLVPTDGGDSGGVTYAALQTTPPDLGQSARRFEIIGELDGQPSIHAAVLLVQSGSDVLSLSLTAPAPEDLAELDTLAPLAVERLGYTGS